MRLKDIELRINEMKNEIDNIKNNYKKELSTAESLLLHFEQMKILYLENIDISTYNNAKRFIEIKGLHRYGEGETSDVVRQLIHDISNNKLNILKQYYGAKDYAGFVCQASNHNYGYGPSHGSIVFSIRATDAWRKGEISPTDDDIDNILYVLENLKKIKLSIGD